MQKQLASALASSAIFLLGTGPAAAQDTDTRLQDELSQVSGSGFTWEGQLEIGNETVFDSTAPGNEISDTYPSLELEGAYAFGNGAAIFGSLVAESVIDPVADRAFEDVGLYVETLGFEFEAGNGVFQLGKISPAFGLGWDVPAGFFATTLAEDYELTEKIGGLADVDMGEAGTLSFGIFYDDNTALSESAGTNRGRNTTAAGGAGNTGKLNNATIQWFKEWDGTFVVAGLRHLTAGTGDVSDESGVVIGAGHSFTPTGLPLDIFGEYASFDGFGGTADKADYLTLNAAYAIADGTTLSGTYARRDVTSAGATTLASLALEYQFSDRTIIGGSFAHVDDAGVKDKIVGVNVIFKFGG